MAELTSAERVLRVLRNEEPDRIPHFEWIIDRHVREAIIPGCSDGRVHGAHGPGRDPDRPGLQQGADRRETLPQRMGRGQRVHGRGAQLSGRGPDQDPGRLPALHAARSARPGPVRQPGPAGQEVQRQAGHRRPPERRVLDPALPDRLRRTADGLGGGPGSGAQAGRAVGRSQPGDGPRGGPPRGRFRLHRRRLRLGRRPADVARHVPRTVRRTAETRGHGLQAVRACR